MFGHSSKVSHSPHLFKACNIIFVPQASLTKTSIPKKALVTLMKAQPTKRNFIKMNQGFNFLVVILAAYNFYIELQSNLEENNNAQAYPFQH